MIVAFFFITYQLFLLPTDLHTPNICFYCIIFDARVTGGTSGNQLVVDPPSPWVKKGRRALLSVFWLDSAAAPVLSFRTSSAVPGWPSTPHCSFMFLASQCPKSLEWTCAIMESLALCVIDPWLQYRLRCSYRFQSSGLFSLNCPCRDLSVSRDPAC